MIPASPLRVLQSIVAAVPIRLMKRDLLFVAEQLLPLLDEKRLEMVARNRSIRAKDGESVGKLLTAFIRKADDSTIGKLIIEAVILPGHSQTAVKVSAQQPKPMESIPMPWHSR